MLLASQLGEIERRTAAKGRKGGSDSDTLRLSRKMEGILSRKKCHTIAAGVQLN